MLKRAEKYILMKMSPGKQLNNTLTGLPYPSNCHGAMFSPHPPPKKNLEEEKVENGDLDQQVNNLTISMLFARLWYFLC